MLSPRQGVATALTTACGAAAGTGNLNTYANLSINSTVTYTIRAPLLSSFSGTATNTVAITLTGTTVDVTPSNNTVTVTSTVSPAGSLTVAKTKRGRHPDHRSDHQLHRDRHQQRPRERPPTPWSPIRSPRGSVAAP